MSSREVRTRIAPSPTGDPHVGTAYQALFNHVFARSMGGVMVLRIEDTDQLRSTARSEQQILESLSWLGIPWDEGPDVGGPHAPYRQSERTAIYQEHAARLIEQGHAYRSFLDTEEIERLRLEQREQGIQAFRDFAGRERSAEESRRRADAGEPHVIRMKVPDAGECLMKDFLRGEVRKDWASIDDQILIKSDGFPTYHLANVVDDHLMRISHVIRGEEWISSLPKHVKLYEYFGWEPPVFCHLPLLRNADKTKSKLSKRKNPTSINYYRRAGYLPQALRNFLALLGWSMPGGEEKFDLEAMIAAFRLEHITLGGPVFDVQKLRWLNARYIREDYDATALRRELETWALNAKMIESILPLAQPRLETLADWGHLTAFFFSDEVPFDPGDLKLKGRDDSELPEVLQMVVWRFEALPAFEAESIERTLVELAEKLDLKIRVLTSPLYVAVSGSRASTPLYQSMQILGSDIVRMRLRRAIESLGGLSSKKLKALEKKYATLFSPEKKGGA